MTKLWITPRVVAVGLVLGLSACTNPYDPVQRTIGGGLLGAGGGAAIGAIAGGGHGAALGAAVGGTVGAVGYRPGFPNVTGKGVLGTPIDGEPLDHTG